MSKILSSSKWYYVLSLGFLVNFFVVIVLIMYILRRRARKGLTNSLLGGSRGTRYSPVAKSSKKIMSKTASSLPFENLEESSSETEDFMKPYSDEPEDSPTFMKPYKDEEEDE